MKKLNELMTLIRERTGLHLGEKSLKKLGWFIEGYVYARNSMDEEEFKFIEEFQEFVEKKYEMSKYNSDIKKSYVEIIKFHTQCDEKGVDKFFELYDEFLANKGL